MYIKYIWFGLVGFYGISTIVGYLMSTGATEYTDWTLVEEQDSPNVCSGHETKQSDG